VKFEERRQLHFRDSDQMFPSNIALFRSAPQVLPTGHRQQATYGKRGIPKASARSVHLILFREVPTKCQVSLMAPKRVHFVRIAQTGDSCSPVRIWQPKLPPGSLAS
jgi:hypothetical protein